jgi:hypothetical protein
VRPTDSNHDHPIAPNRLATAPKAAAANQIWVFNHLTHKYFGVVFAYE